MLECKVYEPCLVDPLLVDYLRLTHFAVMRYSEMSAVHAGCMYICGHALSGLGRMAVFPLAAVGDLTSPVWPCPYVTNLKTLKPVAFVIRCYSKSDKFVCSCLI